MGRNGSGVREASETSYEITFTYRGERCRERIKLKPSPTNRRRVEHHLGAIVTAIENGTFDYATTFPNSKRLFLYICKPANILTIESYLDDWLEGKEKQLKNSTHKGYTKIVNNIIIPQFKGKALSDIKRPDIRKWLAEMSCSNKNLTNIQSVLRAALQDAVNDDILEANPMYGWTYKNNEAPRKIDDVDPFTAQEQKLILAELDGQNKNMMQFFFWTGLRTSELVALNWDDINWLNNTVSINKAITQGSDKIEVPKTSSSIREVKLLKPALDALERQKQFTAFKNVEIFQNPRTGERWTGDQAIRKTVWRPALKRANIKYRRPYQTRHTYASMMLTAGESVSWLAQQMGHRDWAMLKKTYAKFIKDALPDAGEKAVAMFSENAGKKAGITTPNHPKKQA